MKVFYTEAEDAVLDVPDTPENVRAFGRPEGGRSPGAFPHLQADPTIE